MTRLAKSSHVVLREASDLLRSYGAPGYVVDRMAILAQVSKENREEGDRLVASVYNCLREEVGLLGEGEPVEGIRQ